MFAAPTSAPTSLEMLTVTSVPVASNELRDRARVCVIVTCVCHDSAVKLCRVSDDLRHHALRAALSLLESDRVAAAATQV
jgi:hypothetical protein